MIQSEFHFQTDFGDSKYIPEEEDKEDDEEEKLPPKISFVGTPLYVSPEMLNDKGGVPASDLWALGCIIY